MVERQLRRKDRTRPAEAERKIRQDEANELYKARTPQQTEMMKLREQGRMDQAKRILDVQKLQQSNPGWVTYNERFADGLRKAGFPE
jgi:hypothetical protein